jgi:hypothetical protein
VTCPVCAADIPRDSLYCDICGERLMFCPLCGKPGGGKRCIYDGTPLEAAAANTDPGDGSGPAVENDPAGVPPLELRSPEFREPFRVRNGDLLGRTEGRFRDLLADRHEVSGRHASFSFDPRGGWTVTDLGSTNGTAVNGVPVTGSARLRDRDTLLIADLEFTVSIPRPGIESPDRTVRLGSK